MLKNKQRPARKISIEIRHCGECPYHTTQRHYTSDSFEMAFDYYCTKVQTPDKGNKQIASYIERDWELPSVPDWCPILDEK